MQHVRDVVTAVVASDAALQDLRHDPAALARTLNLSGEHVAALHSADRFFETENAIADRPGPIAPARPAGPASARVFAVAPPPATGVTVSADSGTLLPGPTSGTYTIVSSASATSTPVTGMHPGRPPAVPGVPGVPAPGVPSVPPGRPPSVPGIPSVPRVPSAPMGPVPPSKPSAPVVPSAPSCPPGSETAFQAACGVHCGCEAAIVAVVASVSATANVAITALTAIAKQHKHAPNSTRNEVLAP